MSSSQPRIAIVGGGPGGLTLGVLLARQKIPFTIFELRQQPTDEELALPSGMLDLHQESGLAALKDCGLYEDFLPLTDQCAETQKVADKHGTILFEEDESRAFASHRPEIPRNALNKLLFAAIPADSIRWGHKLYSCTTSATPSSSGSAETVLDFGSQGKHAFDLVIGADGAWSKVRDLLTDVKPHYAGLHIITLTIRHVTKKYPHLAKLVGPGSFAALGDGYGVVSQRGPMDSARLYIFLTKADPDYAATSGLAGKSPTGAKAQLLGDTSLLGTWGTSIKELVAAACDEEAADNPGEALDIRGLYELPHGLEWPHQPGATIIGDAAHLLRPNGEGVNIAMLDALLLSRAIGQAFKAATPIGDLDSNSSINGTSFASTFQNALKPLLKDFETDMAVRAKKTGEDTEELIAMMFEGDGSRNMLAEFFKGVFQNKEGLEEQINKKLCPQN
ncbi:hypothetical protein BX600DRAFT_383398 [Xylariales sp. PMI_506]|nr:hypothetical protein BX600DRAFT_383398 [Xylariales sp. PMI_506]